MSNSWGSVDFSAFERWSKQIDKAIADNAAQKLTEQVLLELANRVLRRTKQKTPVDTGTMRRSWQVGEVVRHGDYLEVEIYNPVEYAEFVEYGHRQEPGRYVPALGKQLKQSYVPGQYMLTLSIKEVEALAPALIGKRSDEFMRRLLGHD